MKLKNPRLTYDLQALKGYSALVGVDEAGRGALAGPVVAAAVRLTEEFYRDSERIEGCRAIRDSKRISEFQREHLFSLMQIWKEADVIDFSWAQATVGEIEQYNILGATQLAMERALEILDQRALSNMKMPRWDESSLFTPVSKDARVNKPTVRVLLDGRPMKRFRFKHEGLVQGDDKSLAIAMASIVAKVQRDHIMSELDTEFPEYGLARHKGYGTQLHKLSIMESGEASVHRPSFLRKFLLRSKEPSVQMDLLLF